MRVCFDASAALAFALQDEPRHMQAKVRVRQLAARGATLCAPPLFAYECASIIRLRVFYAEARGVELITTDKPFFEAANGAKRPKSAPALTFVTLL